MEYCDICKKEIEAWDLRTDGEKTFHRGCSEDSE